MLIIVDNQSSDLKEAQLSEDSNNGTFSVQSLIDNSVEDTDFKGECCLNGEKIFVDEMERSTSTNEVSHQQQITERLECKTSKGKK